MPEWAVWAIILFPLTAAGFNGLFVRPTLGSTSRVAAATTITAIAASLALSIWALSEVFSNERVSLPTHEVLAIGQDFTGGTARGISLQIGLLLDGLTAVMLIVAASVSLLVQIYSHGYMSHDSGYVRYYTYMPLFTAAMFTLVLANNLVLLYAGWELVGLSSYLLIGFWFHRPAAAAAAKKAFIVTRFGDFFFLLSIVGIYFLWPDGEAVTFVINDPSAPTDIIRAAGTAIAGTSLTLIALGIFAGAAGKSAQFPLHVWLPDAMEGPTPVSALIHAATMVAAGIFLVARFLPLFEADGAEAARTTVTVIGVFTVIFAASMGLVMNDIKRVLAYSTVSQLGYMMMALGLGAIGPAIFHLFTHAFFKALLFLGAGSVNHATDTFDMRQMGGLRRAMPWTYVTFLVGALSLAGLPPLSGFWSKDAILGFAWSHEGVLSQIVFWGGGFGAFLTALYVMRAFYMTFHGTYRGNSGTNASGHENEFPEGVHESPAVMVAPLVVLATFAIGAWVVDAPGVHFLTDLLEPLGAEAEKLALAPIMISTAAVLAGIAVASWLYRSGAVSAPAMSERFRPLTRLLTNKYYMDDLYEGVIVRRALFRGVWRAIAWFDSDRGVVDRAVNTVGLLGRNVGRAVARAQSGQLQAYAAVFSLGVVVIFAVYAVWGG
jgi:NADH-quinone oxidoreductase subunit L